VSHEGLLSIWELDTPNRARGLSAVNNLYGKFS
jgi:hypothetical protein